MRPLTFWSAFRDGFTMAGFHVPVAIAFSVSACVYLIIAGHDVAAGALLGTAVLDSLASFSAPASSRE
jgi:hypothetical protein